MNPVAHTLRLISVTATAETLKSQNDLFHGASEIRVTPAADITMKDLQTGASVTLTSGQTHSLPAANVATEFQFTTSGAEVFQVYSA
tara:strand:+ start:10785 stop:11045 length:261 start_codon:yes stop_codon:yes gene_type:complete